MAYVAEEVKTTPFGDQKPGTSGLRKKVDVFKQEHYLENFVQSIFDVLPVDTKGQSLVVSGDGRYYNDVAIKTIVRIAAANGVGQIVFCLDGHVSNPAASHLIRQLNETDSKCMGGIILTACHNPGGPSGDLGVKFNSPNGGPALEEFTDKVFEVSKLQERYLTIPSLPEVDLQQLGEKSFEVKLLSGENVAFKTQVVDSRVIYADFMETLFDFDKIRALVAKDSGSQFRFCFDSMNGVAGPYAKHLFCERLGVDPKQIRRAELLQNFGGLPENPLAYADEILSNLKMEGEEDFDFGAACDSDADSNRVFGKRFRVSASDNIALIFANYRSIKYLREQGITGAARSMPTSGNLLDQNMISICGEESFGTGSNHVREKDGLWAVLCWLAILADTQKPVETIVREHWAKYGRNYYQRYDYEGLDNEVAAKVFERIVEQMPVFSAVEGQSAEIFSYTDPVDKSVSDNQGWIFKYADGSRFIFRKSGTGSSGTTIRLYLEKYNKDELDLEVSLALKDIITTALDLCQIHEITGLKEPTVIT